MDSEVLQSGASANKIVNPIRWLGEYLVRHHPQSESILNVRGPLADKLSKSAAILKERRVQRELEKAEHSAKMQAEKFQMEMEVARQEADNARKQKEAQLKEMEAKDQERNKRGEKAAVSAIGISKASLILGFRNKCMSLVNAFDFREAFLSNKNLSELNSTLYTETCRYLVLNSPASFAAAVSLEDSDTLHYHTTANKREQAADGDSTGAGP